MTGEFKEEDAKKVKQSVRRDGYWNFFKKNLQIQFALKNNKLDITEIGSGTGDNCILTNKSLSYLLNKYTCIDASKEMLKFIEIENFKTTELIHQNLDENQKIPKSDIVIAKFMFHHLKNKEEVINNIYNSLNKNGALLIIDKFPILPIKLVNLIEKIFHITGYRKQLGKHYYTEYPKFKKIINKFDLEDEIIKQPKSFKNFYVIRVFLVLRKKTSDWK